MRTLIILSILSVGIVSSVQAVEADFQARINSVQATEDKEGEKVRIIATAKFKDVEDLVIRASQGESIHVSFNVRGPYGDSVYDQNTDLVFPATGEGKVIIGNAKSGRIVAKYDTARVTFLVRFVINQDQAGTLTTTTTEFDQYEVSVTVHEVSEGVSYRGTSVVNSVFSNDSTAF